MNKQQRLKQWIAALALAGFLAPVSIHAQDDEQARGRAVELASEAITAKESGDLLTAKSKLEEVIRLNPADESAKELLEEVNKGLLAGKSAPAAPLSAIDRIAEENLNLFREVDAAMIDARSIAATGNFDGALALLDQAAAALPANTAGQSQHERVNLLKQQILAARDSGAGGTKALAAHAIADQVRVSKDRVSDARRLIAEANSLVSSQRYDDASAALDKAEALLPVNATAEVARMELKKSRSRLLESRYETSVDKRDITQAEKSVEAYEALNGASDKRAVALRADLAEKKKDPHYQAITDVSPEFAAREKKADELLVKGRAQYLYGDYLGALETYKEVLQYQPYNTEAKSFSIRIRETLHDKSGAYNLGLTKTKFLEAVDMKWATAESFNKDVTEKPSLEVEDQVVTRMKSIKVPQASLRGIPLDKAIETLGELSLAYDKDQKGVNFVTIDPEHKNPEVNLTLRDMTLDRVLEQVLRSVNFSYSVNNGIVEVRPDVADSGTETEFFPLSQGAVVRMTGTGAKASGDASNPFGGGGGDAGGGRPEVDGLKRYFRGVGMEFDETKGQGLNFDGQQLIVTHNRRVLERVRNILRRYSDVKQVNIESKFIEVNQGNLNQIAANWTVTNTKTVNGVEQTQFSAISGNRTLDSAFRTNQGGTPGLITSPDQEASTVVNGNGAVVGAIPARKGLNVPIPNNAPALPNASNFGGTNTIGAFGAGSPSFAGTYTTTFGIGGYDVNMFVQALEQTTGSDLMAAPSLTVKDGQVATIKIAQLLRYPESYSQIQSNVSSSGGGTNNGSVGGGASVSITAGTPQDFTVQEVGVVMEVTPTVQADGESIELDLKPKITEFEGFVEYGGTSVAVANGTVVTVPSGFYQPIFSIREVATRVTVSDGATVVIGGLTREEVKTVHDKVPVLGDLPLVGKLFRSDGKTSSKKNLMIFVTANMISPTGSQLRGTVGGVRGGTTFANPTLTSPSGPLYRAPVEAK